MRFEDFDKKIKDAAENHHPAYDEHAWSKMEQLLDVHMPVEKEKKRRFLLLFFFLVLLGGGSLIWLGTGAFQKGSSAPLARVEDNDRDQHSTRNATGMHVTQPEKDLPNGASRGNAEGAIREEQRNGDQDLALQPDNEDEGLPRKNKGNTVDPGGSAYIQEKNNRQPAGLRKDPAGVHKIGDPLLKDPDRKDAIAIAIQPGSDKPSSDPGLVPKIKTEVPVSLAKTEEQEHERFAPIDSFFKAELKKPDLIRTARKKGILFLAASVAPDLSVVGLKEMGKIRTAYGFGIGYAKGRVTLRSGLYIARKVYDAYPEDYKAPAAFYSRYPNLQEIKADCKVYEIPLLISYDLKKKNSHWFLTTGLSSYLMKRETYDYYYKWNTAGPVVHRERTITNANQHYFSVASFSAGYKTNLSKKFTFMAEPYVKVPVTGIGFGKVKLNSAGILFSIGYKPFQTKIRK